MNFELHLFIDPLQSLINAEIQEITNKITVLDTIRNRLEENLLKLHEEELELEDERKSPSLITFISDYDIWIVEGVHERHAIETGIGLSAPTFSSRNPRRSKAPSFLPSEHDDLPPGVAFMVSMLHLLDDMNQLYSFLPRRCHLTLRQYVL